MHRWSQCAIAKAAIAESQFKESMALLRRRRQAPRELIHPLRACRQGRAALKAPSTSLPHFLSSTARKGQRQNCARGESTDASRRRYRCASSVVLPEPAGGLGPTTRARRGNCTAQRAGHRASRAASLMELVRLFKRRRHAAQALKLAALTCLMVGATSARRRRTRPAIRSMRRDQTCMSLS